MRDKAFLRRLGWRRLDFYDPLDYHQVTGHTMDYRVVEEAQRRCERNIRGYATTGIFYVTGVTLTIGFSTFRGSATILGRGWREWSDTRDVQVAQDTQRWRPVLTMPEP